jgi:hypothetical protein
LAGFKEGGRSDPQEANRKWSSVWDSGNSMQENHLFQGRNIALFFISQEGNEIVQKMALVRMTILFSITGGKVSFPVYGTGIGS